MSVSDRDTVTFLGVGFAKMSLHDAADWVEAQERTENFAFLLTPNVDHMVMYHDPGEEPWRKAYRSAVAECGLCLNDSRILARLARLSGLRLDVVPGSDLVREMVRRERVREGSIALVGGFPREADWLRSALPNHSIAHFEPPMGVRDNEAAQDAIADFVERERADLVLFAIGAPQSEIVALKLARRGKARGVALCIGASVEFLSGSKRRAPGVMQKLGLEWLFRLLSEPGRLWRRYLVKGPRIFAIWWRWRALS